MKSEPALLILDYGRYAGERRWRTRLAALLAAPVGIAAGWGVYEAGMGSIVALGLAQVWWAL